MTKQGIPNKKDDFFQIRTMLVLKNGKIKWHKYKITNYSDILCIK